MMKFLRLSLAVTIDSFFESSRNRFFTIFSVFACAAIYASLLAGIMAVDQEARVITDFGLALIELVTLAYTLFYSSSVLLREAETKTIYLVFSRPVPRGVYLAGKLAGIMLTAAVMLAGMGIIHAALLALRGFRPPQFYVWALAGSFLKLAVITAIAFLVSLFSTSAVSTMVISGILWTAGHFASEVRFMTEHSTGAAAWALRPALWLIPNFQLFNARDAAGAIGVLPAAAFTAAAAWTLAAYLCSLWLISRKEF